MKVLIASILSVAYFAAICFLLVGSMMGECFPGRGNICPTDHERNVGVMVILVGGVTLYLVVGFGIRYLLAHRKAL